MNILICIRICAMIGRLDRGVHRKETWISRKGRFWQERQKNQYLTLRYRKPMLRRALKTARLRQPEELRLRLGWLPGKKIACRMATGECR
jgi:hypothetical protein